MTSKNVPRLRFKDFNGVWNKEQLGTILNYEQPTKYIVNSTKYSNDFNIPVLTAGKNFVLGYTNENSEKRASKDNPVIIFDDFTTSSHFVDFSFKVKSSAMKILYSQNTNIYFAYCVLSNIKYVPKTHSRQWISIFEDIDVMIPTKLEQEKISNFLYKLDYLIDLHSQKLEQLEKLKRGYLQRMFPQKGETVPRLRFSGFSGKWEEVKLGDLMDIGSVPRIHQKDWRNEGIPFLRARDIVSSLKTGQYSNDRLYIDKSKYEELSKTCGKVKKGDLLITGVGTIGKPFLVRDDSPLYFKDGNILWMKNGSIINPELLFFIMSSSVVQDEIRSFSGVGTVGTYTISSAKKTKVKITMDKKEQQKISNFFIEMDRLIEKSSNIVDELKRQKKAYLQKMFI